MIEFPDIITIPLADWVDNIMSWLLNNLEGVFDAIGFVILQVMLTVENFFLYLPWFVMILIIFAAGWTFIGKWYHGVGFALMLFLIGTFGYWEHSMRTLSLVLTAVIFSLLIGLPLGILMASHDKEKKNKKKLRKMPAGQGWTEKHARDESVSDPA